MKAAETYKTFQELEVWKASRRLKLDIYDLVKTFPAEEKYNLSNQIIRSSRSTPANISEGYGRFTYKDQIHFCIQARGSLFETLNHIIDAQDCKYISEEVRKNFELKIRNTEVLLNGYIAWLRKMITQANQ